MMQMHRPKSGAKPVRLYGPINEAVVVESIGDVIRVLIVRADGVEDQSGIEFSATPTQ
jgi:hypothetical protein